MAVSFATISARRATVKINIDSEVLNVTYNRSVITPDLQAKIKDWGETDVGSLVLFTKAAVVEWDLLGEDGKPLPLDEKTLGAVPTDIHVLIHRAIYEDIDPSLAAPESTG